MAERIFCVALFTGLAFRLIPSLHSQPFNFLTLFNEGLVAIFILLRRPAKTMTLRPIDWMIAFAGTLLPLAVAPTTPPLLGTAIPGALLMMIGLIIALWSKITLRWSFGIGAANRGVVGGGPYRMIRHPIYAGYFINYVGFWLNNPSARNGVLYLATFACLILRIACEEKYLGRDIAYTQILGRVPYRLLPGVY